MTAAEVNKILEKEGDDLRNKVLFVGPDAVNRGSGMPRDLRE